MQRDMARVPHGQLMIISASAETRGHGTTGLAKFWAEQLRVFLTGLR